MNQKVIIVAGGAGFIGSNLCARLVGEPSNRVICIDDFSTGAERNIRDLIGKPNFSFILADITSPIDIPGPVDEIYNLACPASPSHYQSDPIRTTLTSVIGAKNLLDLALSKGAKILQASTSEVYGDPISHPQSESDWGNVNPIGIRSCYDEGKRCAESLFMDYHRKKRLRTKIIRIFNTYGPGMRNDDGRVVSNFITQALAGEPLTIYGKGEQTRSFQYVDDLIEGMLRVMQTEDDFIGPVNLGNPNEISILTLAQLIISRIPSCSGIVFSPLPKDDPQRRKPDISYAKKVLGWEPHCDLAQGIDKTIKYFKENA